MWGKIAIEAVQSVQSVQCSAVEGVGRNVKYNPTVIIDSSGNGDDKQLLGLLTA